jgi:hypothetical protein
MSDAPPPSTDRHWWAATDQILFWVSVAFVLLVPTAIGLITSNATIAGITLVCGAFVALMSKFESLAELTIGPLEAKMREVAEVNHATLDAAQKSLVALQAATKLPPSPATSDVIATTTNTAVEAVTAAIRANDVMFTAWPPPAWRRIDLSPGGSAYVAYKP